MNTEKLSEWVEQLADLVKQENIHHLEVETGGHTLSLKKNQRARAVAAAGVAAPAVAVVEAEEDEDDASLIAVTSEVVGLFHMSSTRAGDPVVKEGGAVKAGQVVAFVESMSLNHEVKAKTDGTLVEIIAQEGEPVEYGQALMLLATGG